jgi:hypothetical protein
MEKTTKRVAPDEEFLRSIIFPEEERRLYTSALWCGEYRWFRSANIVCIEHYRQRRDTPAIGSE